MNHFKSYVNPYLKKVLELNGEEPIEFDFETLDDLLAHKYLQLYAKLKSFNYFALSDGGKTIVRYDVDSERPKILGHLTEAVSGLPIAS